MAAPSEFTSEMVTYLHADSHVKPLRVKIRMQMKKTGRKRHKNNECWSLGGLVFALDKNWFEEKQRSV